MNYFLRRHPTERRVLAAFLYHAGLPYHPIKPFVDRSYEAIRHGFTDWSTCQPYLLRSARSRRRWDESPDRRRGSLRVGGSRLWNAGSVTHEGLV